MPSSKGSGKSRGKQKNSTDSTDYAARQVAGEVALVPAPNSTRQGLNQTNPLPAPHATPIQTGQIDPESYAGLVPDQRLNHSLIRGFGTPSLSQGINKNNDMDMMGVTPHSTSQICCLLCGT
jgi:hypothetical protein